MLLLNALAAVAHVAANAPAAKQDLSNSYRLEARFDPETGAISVEGTMQVVADRRKDSLRLLLNDSLQVRTFTANGIAAKIEPTMRIGSEVVPGAQGISVPLTRPLERGERLPLRFSYDGQLTTDSIKVGRGVVSPRWTELTLEAFWYPILIEEQLVRSELFLTVPDRFQVTGPGLVERLAPGRWRLDPQAIVAGRITFALSDSWTVETRALKPGLSAALHTIRPEPRAAEILDSVSAAYAYYERLFGPPRTRKERITLLYPNDEIGLKYSNQAFATAGDFIVMSTGEVKGQLETLQHEVAHLWFSRGRPGTVDEFLSESVSEYLANRLAGEMFGADWLGKRRATMARQSAAIAASFFDLEGHGTAPHQLLLYERGPTALWALHDRIGEAAMNGLLLEVYRTDLDSMDQFLDLLARRHGPETMTWFRSQL
jgi:hypothetical protein